MKHSLNASDAWVAALLIVQSACYVIGSRLAVYTGQVSVKTHLGIRMSMAGVFLGLSVTSSLAGFVFWNAALSLLISFSQGGIMALFQSYSDDTNRRAFGAARTALMSVTGSVGAGLAGMALSQVSWNYVFLGAFGVAVFGVWLFTGFRRAA